MTHPTDHDITAVEVGPDDPATDVSVETLRSGLQSDDAGIRLQTANVASFVPREDVETLKAVVPSLIDCLEDDKRVIVHQSGISLSLVAEDEPELLEPAIPVLVDLLEHDLSHVRAISARCLSNVVVDQPEYFTGEIESLLDVAQNTLTATIPEEKIDNPDLDPEQRQTLQGINAEEGTRHEYAREVSANLIVEIARHDPAAVRPHVSTVIDILDDGNPSVATALVDVVGLLAREDHAVSGATDTLSALLDHPDDTLVATVVSTLGFIGDDSVTEPLRAVADDENRPVDLQELADETADFLEN